MVVLNSKLFSSLLALSPLQKIRNLEKLKMLLYDIECSFLLSHHSFEFQVQTTRDLLTRTILSFIIGCYEIFNVASNALDVALLELPVLFLEVGAQQKRH